MSKIFDNFLKYFVGILFIFSGLVKVNDPIGTSIKLKEYFEVFANDFAPFFEIFIPYSLVISVFVVVLEVLLGLALLLNYRMKLTAWLFLLLIAFFTFLTLLTLFILLTFFVFFSLLAFLTFFFIYTPYSLANNFISY